MVGKYLKRKNIQEHVAFRQTSKLVNQLTLHIKIDAKIAKHCHAKYLKARGSKMESDMG